MRKFLIAAFLLCSFSYKSFCLCKVYFYTGTVEIVSKNKTVRALNAVNETVTDEDILRINENGEVILRDANGQFAIIHAAGSYNYAQINEAFKLQQGKSLVSSLQGFLGTEITKSNVDIRKMAESYMKQKGGVTRSGNVYPLMIWPAYGSINESNQVKFVWNSVAKVDSYQVIIFGGEDANNPVEMARTVTSDTFLDVTFKDYGVSSDAYFSWVAYPKEDPNHSRFTFKIITSKEFKDLLAEVNHDCEKGANAEEKALIKAASFEKRGLILPADQTYKDLLQTNNGNNYKDLYLLFRLRNNMVN